MAQNCDVKMLWCYYYYNRKWKRFIRNVLNYDFIENSKDCRKFFKIHLKKFEVDLEMLLYRKCIRQREGRCLIYSRGRGEYIIFPEVLVWNFATKFGTDVKQKLWKIFEWLWIRWWKCWKVKKMLDMVLISVRKFWYYNFPRKYLLRELMILDRYVGTHKLNVIVNGKKYIMRSKVLFCNLNEFYLATLKCCFEVNGFKGKIQSGHF